MFKSVPNSKYFINEDGSVVKTEKIIVSQSLDQRGYKKVNVNIKGKQTIKSVHQLVALAFLGNPPGPIGKRRDEYQVNHKDGNKVNNHYSNLEWVTCLDNIKHATEYKLFRGLKGISNPNSKLTDELVYQIRIRASKGESCTSIARTLNMNPTHISRVITGKCWKEAPGPITKERKMNNYYILISPSNEEYTTFSLKRFSKDHNISFYSLFNLARGSSRESPIGWKVIKYSKGKIVNNIKPYENKFLYTFISPSKEVFQTINLKEFCRRYKELSYKTLTNKSFELKEYKGWIIQKQQYIPNQ
ncbi:HNH endonuclease [Calothrix sp. FACHB-1219]|uniref:HNH endonuclease n=1 Tax=unclassified Calothrix TaxID=2619626 RepID=UPI00168715D9|nr:MULTISPECIES: HNH endonuclease [unclassified Calothrix]MBD2201546.1 HNH endonuclease [Calothrix sp. FACHB-168]MBD2217232.1 HNH endonuclease [Calothrix sp. FACHB-1219]